MKKRKNQANTREKIKRSMQKKKKNKKSRKEKE